MTVSTRARNFAWPGRLPPVAFPWAAAVLLITCAAGAAFTRLAISQWDSYQANAYDLGIFDQVVWNTARGDWFQTSFVSYGNYLGQHFSPILAVFAPLYWLGAGPASLTIVQAAVAAAAAVPLYLAARRWELPAAVAAALPAAYLLNGYLHRAIAFDFHPETLVALPVFGALLALASGRTWLAAALGASTLLFKEDSVFVALAIAALLAVSGARREGTALAAVAFVWTIIAVGIVMPWLRDGVPNDILPRYGYLAPGATSEAELMRGALADPAAVVRAFASEGRLWTAAVFLCASAPIAVLRPGWLLVIIPGLSVSLLSSYEWQRELQLHYAAQAVPLAVLAAMLTARHLVLRAGDGVVAAAIIVPALAGFFALSPLSPFADDEARRPSERHREALGTAIALIPPGETVSAQSKIVPRLSQRPLVDEFPGRALEVDWVVVDRLGSRSTSALDAGFWDALARVRARYLLAWERDGVEIYRNPRTTEPLHSH